jgi:NADH dehydrogenase (ubiquinone) Fe-S protein 6
MSSLARAMRVPRAAFTTSARQLEAAVPTANKSQTSPTPIDENKPAVINQAPNRVEPWSRSQQPRSKAMTGPRFEQTNFDEQVRA